MLVLVGLEFLIEASASALPEATDLDLGQRFVGNCPKRFGLSEVGMTISLLMHIVSVYQDWFWTASPMQYLGWFNDSDFPKMLW